MLKATYLEHINKPLYEYLKSKYGRKISNKIYFNDEELNKIEHLNFGRSEVDLIKSLHGIEILPNLKRISIAKPYKYKKSELLFLSYIPNIEEIKFVFFDRNKKINDFNIEEYKNVKFVVISSINQKEYEIKHERGKNGEILFVDDVSEINGIIVDKNCEKTLRVIEKSSRNLRKIEIDEYKKNLDQDSYYEVSKLIKKREKLIRLIPRLHKNGASDEEVFSNITKLLKIKEMISIYSNKDRETITIKKCLIEIRNRFVEGVATKEDLKIFLHLFKEQQLGNKVSNEVLIKELKIKK